MSGFTSSFNCFCGEVWNMNYTEKIQEIKRIKSLFLNPYGEGLLKITSGESELHARVKAQVFHYLKSNDYEVYSEVNLRGYPRRVDIFAIHPSTQALIIEILASESEIKALEKEINSPEGIDFIKVVAKDFNYSDFKL